MRRLQKIVKQLVHTRVAAQRRAAVPREGEPPILRRIEVMKGTRERSCGKVCVLGAVVVVLVRPRYGKERRPVDADRFAVFDRNVPRTVVGHILRETVFALFRRGMIREIILRQIFLRRILVLLQLLRLVGEIIAHTCHCRRAAAGIEPRARHDAEAPLVRLVLRRERNILGNRIVDKCIHLSPVHESRVHVEERHAVVLCRRLCIVMRAVLSEPVRHLMPENGGELVHVPVQPMNESTVDGHVVGRIARRIKDRTVCQRPCKGQGVRAQHIVAVLDQPLHDAVHETDVILVLGTPLLLEILPFARHLRLNVVAHRKHGGERRFIRTEHAERLRRDCPCVDCLRARHREEYPCRKDGGCEHRREFLPHIAPHSPCDDMCRIASFSYFLLKKIFDL